MRFERSESGLINPLLLKMTACITPLALMISLQAQAGEFALGEITGRANGSISVGGIWNAEKPDSNLIFRVMLIISATARLVSSTLQVRVTVMTAA